MITQKRTLPRIFFVCRHPSMLDWAKRKYPVVMRNPKLTVVNSISHKDISDGDIVIGRFSLYHVWQLCAAGARVWYFECHIPRSFRFRREDLTVDEIEEFGGKLIYFKVSGGNEIPNV